MTVPDNNSTTPTESTSRFTNSSGYAGTRVFNSRTFVGGTGAQIKAGPSGFQPFSRRRRRTIRPTAVI